MRNYYNLYPINLTEDKLKFLKAKVGLTYKSLNDTEPKEGFLELNDKKPGDIIYANFTVEPKIDILRTTKKAVIKEFLKRTNGKPGMGAVPISFHFEMESTLNLGDLDKPIKTKEVVRISYNDIMKRITRDGYFTKKKIYKDELMLRFYDDSKTPIIYKETGRQAFILDWSKGNVMRTEEDIPDYDTVLNAYTDDELKECFTEPMTIKTASRYNDKFKKFLKKTYQNIFESVSQFYYDAGWTISELMTNGNINNIFKGALKLVLSACPVDEDVNSLDGERKISNAIRKEMRKLQENDFLMYGKTSIVVPEKHNDDYYMMKAYNLALRIRNLLEPKYDEVIIKTDADLKRTNLVTKLLRGACDYIIGDTAVFANVSIHIREEDVLEALAFVHFYNQEREDKKLTKAMIIDAESLRYITLDLTKNELIERI